MAGGKRTVEYERKTFDRLVPWAYITLLLILVLVFEVYIYEQGRQISGTLADDLKRFLRDGLILITLLLTGLFNIPGPFSTKRWFIVVPITITSLLQLVVHFTDYPQHVKRSFIFTSILLIIPLLSWTVAEGLIIERFNIPAVVFLMSMVGVGALVGPIIVQKVRELGEFHVLYGLFIIEGILITFHFAFFQTLKLKTTITVNFKLIIGMIIATVISQMIPASQIQVIIDIVNTASASVEKEL